MALILLLNITITTSTGELHTLVVLSLGLLRRGVIILLTYLYSCAVLSEFYTAIFVDVQWILLFKVKTNNDNTDFVIVCQRSGTSIWYFSSRQRNVVVTVLLSLAFIARTLVRLCPRDSVDASRRFGRSVKAQCNPKILADIALFSLYVCWSNPALSYDAIRFSFYDLKSIHYSQIWVEHLEKRWGSLAYGKGKLGGHALISRSRPWDLK